MLRIHDCLSFKDPVGRVYTTSRVLLRMRDNVKIHALNNCAQYLFVQLEGNDSVTEGAILQMCGRPSGELAEANVLWPELVCYRLDNDMFCGFLTRAMEISDDLIPLSQLLQRDTSGRMDIGRKTVTGLNLARCIQAVHGGHVRYRIGPLQPEDFYVAPEEGRVFYCAAYRCGLELKESNILFAAPEYHAMGENIDRESDAFSFAMIFFQLITGVLPFGSHEPGRLFDLEQIVDMVLDGESIYYYEYLPQAAAILRTIQENSPELALLFRQTFDYCGRNRYEEDRPSVDDWIRALKSLCDLDYRKTGGSRGRIQ